MKSFGKKQAIQLGHQYGSIWCSMGNLGLMMIGVFSPGMDRDKYINILHYSALCKLHIYIYLNIGKHAVFIRKQRGFLGVSSTKNIQTHRNFTWCQDRDLQPINQ